MLMFSDYASIHLTIAFTGEFNFNAQEDKSFTWIKGTNEPQ